MSATATQDLDRTVEGQPFPAVGTYTFDVAHSAIVGTVRHMVVSKARVRFNDFTGTITVAPDATQSVVNADFVTASIDSGDDKRDAHLMSPDFLDAETFPHISFRSTRIEPGWKIIGELTIRDTTREVVLETTYLGTAKSPMGPVVAAFSATTVINREDFGVTWNAPMEAGGVLVGKDVTIELDIQATLDQAE